MIADCDQGGVLKDRSSWLLRPGWWFWLCLILGALIRIYFVGFTLGTTDVSLWEWHAQRAREVGVVGHYHDGLEANHPPFISAAQSLVLRASESLGIPFRVLLRAPFAMLDAGSTMLLILLLRTNPWRYVVAVAYWLNPLAMIFSSYHGNTDSAIAFFLLLCCWLLGAENVAGAAFVLGVSAWIKLPGLLVAPALVLFIKGWNRRLIFVGVAAITTLIGFLPALIQDPGVVFRNVLGYHGQVLHTTAGVWVWGPRVLLFSLIWQPADWPSKAQEPILFLLRHSWQIAIALSLVFTWLRRSHESVGNLCATVGGVYVILYAFSDTWAFQYLAWSLPFWLFLPRWFLIPGTILSGAYIYSLYWVLCGNGLLLGRWDFVGHPHWPPVVIWIRNAAVIFFFIAACLFLACAIRGKLDPRIGKVRTA